MTTSSMNPRELAAADARFLMADAMKAARARIFDDRTQDAGGWWMAAFVLAVEAAGWIPPQPPRSDDD